MNPPAFKPQLRFSIRAILVLMTAFALFLAYHLNWIRQRRAALESGEFEAWSNPFSDDFSDDPSIAAPGVLWLFGENGHSDIWLKAATAERLQKAVGLFPEAEIRYRGQGTEDNPLGIAN